jgi:hypothetical protein
MVTRAVRSVMAASSAVRSTRPSRPTGSQVTAKPSCSNRFTLSSTHLCSVMQVTT